MIAIIDIVAIVVGLAVAAGSAFQLYDCCRCNTRYGGGFTGFAIGFAAFCIVASAGVGLILGHMVWA